VEEPGDLQGGRMVQFSCKKGATHEAAEFYSALAAVWPRVSRAQSSTRPVVGILMATTPAVASRWVQAFQDGLQELGYLAHRDIEIVARYSEGDNARFSGLAEELVDFKPKVILTTSTLSTRAAQHAAAAIPIVNPMLYEPVALGFAANYAHLDPCPRPDGRAWPPNPATCTP
jgi:ABC-type uncharacterized transport system substrate-binding protein